MPFLFYLPDYIFIPRDALTNTKKSGFNIILLQQLQYFNRIVFGGSIIKTDGNFLLIGIGGTNNPYKKI
jgi:hypothetical protein